MSIVHKHSRTDFLDLAMATSYGVLRIQVLLLPLPPALLQLSNRGITRIPWLKNYAVDCSAIAAPLEVQHIPNTCTTHHS